MEGFRASHNWVQKFKAECKLTCRVGTKMLSRIDINKKDEIKKEAETFVQSVRKHFETHDPIQIYNSDQSGFNLEMLSHRTLEVKGATQVPLRCGSRNSLTHSYTIQPLLNASGQLIGPLFVVLHESKDTFGPTVQRKIFKHPLIHVVPSTSGKVSKKILKDWFKDVYFVHSEDDSVLLVDSLNAFKDHEFYKEVMPDGKSIQFETIPPGATGLIQPEDVYFFRLYKAFFRIISDEIHVYHRGFKLSDRNIILKMQASVYYQFQSPIFKDCFKHAWEKCGYIDKVAGRPRYLTPKQFCFSDSRFTTPCALCPNSTSSFMRCAWCTKHLCLNHILLGSDIHYCLHDDE